MDKKHIQKASSSTNSPVLLRPRPIGGPPPTNTPPPSVNEAVPSPLLQPMCWFLLITIVAWLALAFLVTALILCITHNPVNISILAPLASPAYFLYRILKPMLPMDEKRFALSKLKIQKFPKIEVVRNKARKNNQTL